ncbi:MAG: dolichol monophosphate mannose synthase [Phenylobacterium sp.]|nr:dolichol monophosphate mannose synthase [Phenylobacterium sp.]
MAQDDRANRTAKAAAAAGRLELTVVVPTFNEAANVEPLVRKLDAALEGVEWQAIFVDDDSPDGTAAAVKAIAARDRRITCIRRVGRRGLAGAVIEGALASAAPFVAVIDGDLQHDEALLPAMLKILRGGQTDMVIGSRYLEPEARVVSGLDGRRAWGSRFANWLGRRALSVALTDPVSGFFMARREVIDQVAPKLSASGFKVLFDIIASQVQPLRFVELGYDFRPRLAGESKLDNGVVAQYLSLLGSKMTRDLISPRALMFGVVGAGGVLVHLTVLTATRHLGLAFSYAQTLAAVTAMTSNYLVNNAVTYRDRRKRGLALVTGYIRFCLFCSAGLAANVAVATLLRQYVPNDAVAGIAGAAVGAGWNYVTTSLAVW